VLRFNALAGKGGDSLRICGSSLPLQKLEWLSYLRLKTAPSYLHSSGQNTGMWRTDNRQIFSGYYSGLHCEQCGRAEKSQDEVMQRVGSNNDLMDNGITILISHLLIMHFADNNAWWRFRGICWRTSEI